MYFTIAPLLFTVYLSQWLNGTQPISCRSKDKCSLFYNEDLQTENLQSECNTVTTNSNTGYTFRSFSNSYANSTSGTHNEEGKHRSSRNSGSKNEEQEEQEQQQQPQPHDERLYGSSSSSSRMTSSVFLLNNRRIRDVVAAESRSSSRSNSKQKVLVSAQSDDLIFVLGYNNNNNNNNNTDGDDDGASIVAEYEKIRSISTLNQMNDTHCSAAGEPVDTDIDVDDQPRIDMAVYFNRRHHLVSFRTCQTIRPIYMNVVQCRRDSSSSSSSADSSSSSSNKSTTRTWQGLVVSDEPLFSPAPAIQIGTNTRSAARGASTNSAANSASSTSAANSASSTSAAICHLEVSSVSYLMKGSVLSFDFDLFTTGFEVVPGGGVTPSCSGRSSNSNSSNNNSSRNNNSSNSSSRQSPAQTSALGSTREEGDINNNNNDGNSNINNNNNNDSSNNNSGNNRDHYQEGRREAHVDATTDSNYEMSVAASAAAVSRCDVFEDVVAASHLYARSLATDSDSTHIFSHAASSSSSDAMNITSSEYTANTLRRIRTTATAIKDRIHGSIFSVEQSVPPMIRSANQQQQQQQQQQYWAHKCGINIPSLQVWWPRFINTASYNNNNNNNSNHEMKMLMTKLDAASCGRLLRIVRYRYSHGTPQQQKAQEEEKEAAGGGETIQQLQLHMDCIEDYLHRQVRQSRQQRHQQRQQQQCDNSSITRESKGTLLLSPTRDTDTDNNSQSCSVQSNSNTSNSTNSNSSRGTIRSVLTYVTQPLLLRNNNNNNNAHGVLQLASVITAFSNMNRFHFSPVDSSSRNSRNKNNTSDADDIDLTVEVVVPELVIRSLQLFPPARASIIGRHRSDYYYRNSDERFEFSTSDLRTSGMKSSTCKAERRDTTTTTTSTSDKYHEDSTAVQIITIPTMSTNKRENENNVSAAVSAAMTVATSASYKGGISIVANGNVYIFIYVLPKHVNFARKVTEKLKNKCIAEACHIFSKFLIFPIIGDVENEKEVFTYEHQLDLYALPSMRLVLLSVQESIHTLCNQQDVVFMLVGLRALLSFPQPALEVQPRPKGEWGWGCYAESFYFNPNDAEEEEVEMDDDDDDDVATTAAASTSSLLALAAHAKTPDRAISANIEVYYIASAEKHRQYCTSAIWETTGDDNNSNINNNNKQQQQQERQVGGREQHRAAALRHRGVIPHAAYGSASFFGINDKTIITAASALISSLPSSSISGAYTGPTASASSSSSSSFTASDDKDMGDDDDDDSRYIFDMYVTLCLNKKCHPNPSAFSSDDDSSRSRSRSSEEEECLFCEQLISDHMRSSHRDSCHTDVSGAQRILFETRQRNSNNNRNSAIVERRPDFTMIVARHDLLEGMVRWVLNEPSLLQEKYAEGRKERKENKTKEEEGGTESKTESRTEIQDENENIFALLSQYKPSHSSLSSHGEQEQHLQLDTCDFAFSPSSGDVLLTELDLIAPICLEHGTRMSTRTTNNDNTTLVDFNIQQKEHALHCCHSVYTDVLRHRNYRKDDVKKTTKATSGVGSSSKKPKGFTFSTSSSPASSSFNHDGIDIDDDNDDDDKKEDRVRSAKGGGGGGEGGGLSLVEKQHYELMRSLCKAVVEQQLQQPSVSPTEGTTTATATATATISIDSAAAERERQKEKGSASLSSLLITTTNMLVMTEAQRTAAAAKKKKEDMCLSLKEMQAILGIQSISPDVIPVMPLALYQFTFHGSTVTATGSSSSNNNRAARLGMKPASIWDPSILRRILLYSGTFAVDLNTLQSVIDKQGEQMQKQALFRALLSVLSTIDATLHLEDYERYGQGALVHRFFQLQKMLNFVQNEKPAGSSSRSSNANNNDDEGDTYHLSVFEEARYMVELLEMYIGRQSLLLDQLHCLLQTVADLTVYCYQQQPQSHQQQQQQQKKKEAGRFINNPCDAMGRMFLTNNRNDSAFSYKMLLARTQKAIPSCSTAIVTDSAAAAAAVEIDMPWQHDDIIYELMFQILQPLVVKHDQNGTTWSEGEKEAEEEVEEMEEKLLMMLFVGTSTDINDEKHKLQQQQQQYSNQQYYQLLPQRKQQQKQQQRALHVLQALSHTVRRAQQRIHSTLLGISVLLPALYVDLQSDPWSARRVLQDLLYHNDDHRHNHHHHDRHAGTHVDTGPAFRAIIGAGGGGIGREREEIEEEEKEEEAVGHPAASNDASKANIDIDIDIDIGIHNHKDDDQDTSIMDRRLSHSKSDISISGSSSYSVIMRRRRLWQEHVQEMKRAFHLSSSPTSTSSTSSSSSTNSSATTGSTGTGTVSNANSSANSTVFTTSTASFPSLVYNIRPPLWCRSNTLSSSPPPLLNNKNGIPSLLDKRVANVPESLWCNPGRTTISSTSSTSSTSTRTSARTSAMLANTCAGAVDVMATLLAGGQEITSTPQKERNVNDGGQQKQQRQQGTTSAALPPTTIYYVTMASHMTPALENLMLSAAISGVKLTVLGLNEGYDDYSDKLAAYVKFLFSYEQSKTETKTEKSSFSVRPVSVDQVQDPEGAVGLDYHDYSLHDPSMCAFQYNEEEKTPSSAFSYSYPCSNISWWYAASHFDTVLSSSSSSTANTTTHTFTTTTNSPPPSSTSTDAHIHTHTRKQQSPPPQSPPQQQYSVHDSDLVLFMDAYDVLLFPLVHTAPAVLSASKSPILFCGENGIYPEFTWAFFYADMQLNDEDNGNGNGNVGRQKFLNSGCILGRAAQLRHMFAYAHRANRVFRDDQQIFVRYMMEHPSMVSVDSKNNFFVTFHKENYNIDRMALLTLDADFTLRFDGKAVGLAHFNNMMANNMYRLIVTYMSRILQVFYGSSQTTRTTTTSTSPYNGSDSDSDVHESCYLTALPLLAQYRMYSAHEQQQQASTSSTTITSSSNRLRLAITALLQLSDLTDTDTDIDSNPDLPFATATMSGKDVLRRGIQCLLFNATCNNSHRDRDSSGSSSSYSGHTHDREGREGEGGGGGGGEGGQQQANGSRACFCELPANFRHTVKSS